MKTTKIYAATWSTAIQEKLFNGTQSLEFTGIYSITAPVTKKVAKIRVDIKRDSYDNQSYAKISTWNETNGWLPVTSLNFKTTATSSIFYQTKADKLTGSDIDKIGTDTEELIELAMAVIF
jgi:hypothetical protein